MACDTVSSWSGAIAGFAGPVADGAGGDSAEVEVGLALAEGRIEDSGGGVVDWILPAPAGGDAEPLLQHIVGSRVADIALQCILAQGIASAGGVPYICVIVVRGWHFVGEVNAALHAPSGA